MVRVNLGNFVLALVVSIGLVFLFSILPDGDPSEAASILIQAFWLILVVIRVILTIIFALIGMFFFVLLSFIVSALNFFIVDLGGGKAIDTTFLLDIQENALTAVDGFYYGFIDFLVYFKQTVEVVMQTTIIWNPDQTWEGGVYVISNQATNLVQDVIDGGQELIDEVIDRIGGLFEPD